MDKVRIAQDAGYHAALIFGPGRNGKQINMGDGTIYDDILIPAFYIWKEDGVNLTQKFFQERKNGTLFLTIGDFFPDPVQGLDPVYPLSISPTLNLFFPLKIHLFILNIQWA